VRRRFRRQIHPGVERIDRIRRQARLDGGRHIRQSGDALARADGERRELALLDQRKHVGERLHAEIDATGDDFRDRLHAAKGDLLRLEARAHAQAFGTEVRSRPDTRRGVIERSRPGLALGDQISVFQPRAGETTTPSGCWPSAMTGTKSSNGS
jgi:hypothetical protein